MAVRDDIAAILADAGSDKAGRRARLKALRLQTFLFNNLPFTWRPRANVSVIIKSAWVRGTALELMVDLTIRGVTKSLSEWVEGYHNPPDWRIIDLPLFVDDPQGDVEIIGPSGDVRRGRDDLVAAMRVAFVDTFGEKIADLARAGR